MQPVPHTIVSRLSSWNKIEARMRPRILPSIRSRPRTEIKWKRMSFTMSHITTNRPPTNSTSTTIPNSTLAPMIQKLTMSSTEATSPTQNSPVNSPTGESPSKQPSAEVLPALRKIPHSGVMRDRAEQFVGAHHIWTLEHESYVQWRQLLRLWLNPSLADIQDSR